MTHLKRLAERYGIDSDDAEEQRLELLAVFRRGETGLLDAIVKAMNRDAGILSDEELDAKAREVVARIQREELVDSVDEDPSMVLVRGSRFNKSTSAFNRYGGPEMGITFRDQSEKYNDVRVVAKHKRTGLPVVGHDGEEVRLPSKKDYARFGAFLKWRAARCGMGVTLSAHEKGLVNETFEGPWAGVIDGVYHAAVDGSTVKALLLDSTSGGQELSPVAFDEMLVTFPLLHSELFPYVTIRDVPRGYTIETASVNNPTLTWGTAEGSSITLFNTASLVAEISASVTNLMIALEVGRDLLSDSVADIGETLVQLIAERQAAELDRVIAIGNGTTEPLGIFNTSGTTIVAQQSPSPTGWDVTDVEAMLFALGKQYRANRGPSVRYVMTDVSYRRIRGLSVGTTDQRRVFGMDHETYKLFDRPVSVQGDVGHANCAFVDLSRYRLWRRQGAEVRWTDQGETLSRKNTSLLTVRSRWAGKLTDPSAMAEMNSAPA